MPKVTLGTIFVFALTTAQAFATTITFQVTDLGGNDWRYDYVVKNDTLTTPIEEFAIYFDLAEYDNLTPADVPADWNALVLQPDPAIPDDGIFDALALVPAAAIGPGSQLAGFSVSFHFLGVGTPGTQRFEILDPVTFDVLDFGTTQVATSVPEPAIMTMLVLGAAAAGRAQRRRHSSALTVPTNRSSPPRTAHYHYAGQGPFATGDRSRHSREKGVHSL